MVGNKSLFEEAGSNSHRFWTEEEFREAAVKITNADKNSMVIYVEISVTGPDSLREW